MRVVFKGLHRPAEFRDRCPRQCVTDLRPVEPDQADIANGFGQNILIVHGDLDL
jgi:hypothetical protein